MITNHLSRLVMKVESVVVYIKFLKIKEHPTDIFKRQIYYVKNRHYRGVTTKISEHFSGCHRKI